MSTELGVLKEVEVDRLEKFVISKLLINNNSIVSILKQSLESINDDEVRSGVVHLVNALSENVFDITPFKNFAFRVTGRGIRTRNFMKALYIFINFNHGEEVVSKLRSIDYYEDVTEKFIEIVSEGYFKPLQDDVH